MTIVFVTLAAYLLGSISFAVVVSRVFGLADPRGYGSGNPGATNVLRSGNKKAALATLLGDCLKGWLAVWLMQRYGSGWGLGQEAVALVALAVFVGHLWPVFFNFQGGKGVATALGVLMGLNGWLGLATLATWLIVAYAFRYSSLAALISALFAPLYYVWLFGLNPPLLAVSAMSALLIYRHRSNVSKLLAGQESRIGRKSR